MRCFDCFHEFDATEDRFAVLKKLRDLPPGWIGSDIARAEHEALNWDQVFVCGECAGWYGDHPIRLAAVEADPDRGLAT